MRTLRLGGEASQVNGKTPRCVVQGTTMHFGSEKIMLRVMAMALAMGTTFAVCGFPGLAEPLKVVSENAPPQLGASGFVLHSDRIGRDFKVTVYTPPTALLVPGQKLPVIYALDGGYGLAGPQGLLLSNAWAIEPAIIVSVGYLPGESQLRTTDLLHDKLTEDDNRTVGGGGAAFEAFLLEDLRPFIQARYPADGSRSVLFGHSYGGLFTANVFANNPSSFYGYIIGSPWVFENPGLMARVAVAAGRARGQRVYLAVGDREYAWRPNGGSRLINGYTDLLSALKGHPGIVAKARIYTGETHLSYYPRLVMDGFTAVLPPAIVLGAPQPKLPAATLARYPGEYRLPDGRKLTISADQYGRGLVGQVGDSPKFQLQQNGPDRFYSVAVDANVAFDAFGATLTPMGGGTMRAERTSAP